MPPKAVLLGADRPKAQPPPRKKKRLKLAFGEDIRAVDLPLPADLAELVGLVREEFESDKLDIRYTPATVYRVELSVFAARSLPKADREGLCDAVVEADVTPTEAYRFAGFHTANPTVRRKTRVVHKSLNPDFDETLVLLVDGTVDPAKHGRPRLRVTVSDWDEGQAEMIGQLDLDLADMIASSARCHVWRRQEQALRDKLAAMQAQTADTMSEKQRQAREIALTRTINYLAQKRTKTLDAIENMWLELVWVPGCIDTTRVDSEQRGPPRVRGADFKFAKVHLGVKVYMTDYQHNCWLNSYYDFMANVLETVRGALKDKTDEYIKVLPDAHTRTHTHTHTHTVSHKHTHTHAHTHTHTHTPGAARQWHHAAALSVSKQQHYRRRGDAAKGRYRRLAGAKADR